MISGDELLRRMAGKSPPDTEFGRWLPADPKTAIAREPGVALPEAMTVAVHGSDTGTLHTALPPEPDVTAERNGAIFAGLRCCGR